MFDVLIIEDDTYINNLIVQALTKKGYSCKQAFSGTEGLLYAQTESVSLIILDLMLPGMSGEDVLVQLRKNLVMPIIILSSKDSLDTKIDLLNAGAEDYMTKPFELDELIARVGVWFRRGNQHGHQHGHQNDYQHADSHSHKTLTHKDLVLDLENLTATLCQNALAFTKQEYKILELLLTSPKRVFTKQDIYDYAWDDLYIGEDKTINMHISNIRKKIKAYTDEEYIETVWGIGFKISK